jgi:argininosuccinate lyase
MRTLGDCLEVMAGSLATLEVRVEVMAEAAGDPMLLATDLAEVLVREGVAFREAHEAVGRIVAHCVEGGHDLGGLSARELRQFHPAFPSGAGELLDIERSFEQRNLVGGTARASVESALERARSELGEVRERLDGEGLL